MIRFLLIILCLFIAAMPAQGQMTRERAETPDAVSDLFWTPNLVASATVEQIPAGNLNVTIMHTFGIVTNRTLANFFGLDTPPNVRLGLDYGFSDRWSVGIGRTTFSKVVDLRTKYALVRQAPGDGPPLSIGLSANVAVTTVENGQPVSDDLSWYGGLMIGRQFSDKLSLQVTPMISRFATPLPGHDQTLAGLGIGGEYRMSRRYALFAEYLPVFGTRDPGARNPFSVGLNIETGGHVFQLFFTSTTWHVEQYALSHTNTDFGAGDFRFGFNVNRIFGTGN